jgi:hypothetical protein
MNDADVMAPSPLVQDELLHGVEAGWLGTIVVAFCATGLSWLLGTVELNVTLVLWSTFGCAASGLVVDVALERFESRVGSGLAAELGNVLKIFALGALWHALGGIDNPMFLLVFFLPIIAAATLLLRRLVVITAVLSAAVVDGIALFESSELRWYLVHRRPSLESVFSMFPERGAGRVSPFLGVTIGPEFQFVVLLVFTLLVLAAALLSCWLVTRWAALADRFETASPVHHDSADLFRSVLRENPAPTVVVYADSGQIVEASRSFLNQMLIGREALAGKTLFDCVSFADPPSVRALLTERSAKLAFATFQVGREWRTAGIQCHRVRLGGIDYAVLSLIDRHALWYLWKVCDGLDHAILVIRDGSEIVYFNAAAQALCPGLYFGMEPTMFLETQDNSASWWTDNADSSVLTTRGGQSLRVRRIDITEKPAGETLTILAFFSPRPAPDATHMKQARVS